MRKYHDLDPSEQEQAVKQCLDELLEAVVNDGLRFNDSANSDDLQSRIDKAIAKAEKLQTPWFASEYILDDSVVKEVLTGMAEVDAQEALYPEDDETIIRLKK